MTDNPKPNDNKDLNKRDSGHDRPSDGRSASRDRDNGNSNRPDDSGKPQQSNLDPNRQKKKPEGEKLSPKEKAKIKEELKRSSKLTSILILVMTILVVFFFVNQIMGMNHFNAEQIDEIDTGTFVTAVEQGRVKSVTYAANDYTVGGEYYTAQTAGASIAQAVNLGFEALDSKISLMNSTDGTHFNIVTTQALENTYIGDLRRYTTVYVGADALGELLADHPDIQYRITLPNGFASMLTGLLPFLLMAALLIFFFVQMQKAANSQLSFGKNRAKKTTEERPDVKFSDVAGVDEAVEEMQEVKDFLANPEKYQSMGAKIPRGCLLVGPPGTGKTLLARAVAGEAGVPFFSISGSDFVEMFVGVGASRVRDLFKDAKNAAPSIIFIDEIDAVGRQRGAGLGGGHDEREQTLNQLLVEMDGFDASESVVLIAATNRSDVLDPALLRPGRFDRQIVVDTPDVRGREKILQVHSADKPISNDVDLSAVAKITPGFTGADLANLMNEAAILTARKSKKIITMREVNESLERVIAGPERKGRVMDEKVKHTIAYHESGHALVGHLLPGADAVHKISIISRGRALGYTLSMPEDDNPLATLSGLKDELAMFMGGRVAEEIFCDDITTGASNDIERATKVARAIVTQYGFSSLGTQVFGQPNHEVFLGRDYGNTQDYSDETARRIDEEVAKIMKEAHDRAEEILRNHSDQMDLMASVLLERETVEGEACQALLNNEWEDYLEREGDIIAMHEREEAEARARDAAEHPELFSDMGGSGENEPNFLPLPNANARVDATPPQNISQNKGAGEQGSSEMDRQSAQNSQAGQARRQERPRSTDGSGSTASPKGAAKADQGAKANQAPKANQAVNADEYDQALAGITFDGFQLADPDWRDARVEPGDQDANGPYRPAALNADFSDMPTQSAVDAEIAREDLMDSSSLVPDPQEDSGDESSLQDSSKGSAGSTDSSAYDPYSDPYDVRPSSPKATSDTDAGSSSDGKQA